MPRHTNYQFLQREKTRHGKFTWYFRRPGGKRIRLPNEYGTETFWEAYYAAYSGEAPKPVKHLKENTFAWLVEEYKQSAKWKSLAPATQEMRTRILGKMVETGGKRDIRSITRHDIQHGIDRRGDTPHAANNYLKTMRQILSWAEDKGYITANPAEKVKRVDADTDGHHVWTPEEVKKFQERWPIGTRERVAMDLLLYTGLRRSDAVTVGPKDIDADGTLVLKTQKTETEVYIPIIKVLQDTLDAGPIGETFIIGEKGKPRMATSFGTWFRLACIEARVPGRAHGLRKAGATMAAENGATPHELAALFGWTNTRIAEIYTRKADRKRMAKSAMDKMGARTSQKSKGEAVEK